MACPTCDHTMEGLAPSGLNTEESRVFVCPRCGTVKIEDSAAGGPTTYIPKLVGRCRQFEKDLHATVRADERPGVDTWQQLGIDEAINLPGARP